MEYINLHDEADTRQAKAMETISAAKAYQEYCDNYINTILKFTDSTDEDHNIISLYANVDEESNKQNLIYLTRNMYNQILDDEEQEVEVYCSKLRKTVTVKGSLILNALEQTVEEIKVQSLFLKQVIDKSVNSANEFIDSARSLCQGIPGDILEKYADLISGVDPLSSIYNFFAQAEQFIVKKVIKDGDEYIEIVNPNDYTGVNIWLVAFTEIGRTIASFFEGAWKGINRLGEFFKNILNGFVSLIKWVGSKLFSNLFTNYSKGDASVGYMDFPLMQHKLGYVDYDVTANTISYNTNSPIAQMAASVDNGNLGFVLGRGEYTTVIQYYDQPYTLYTKYALALKLILDQMVHLGDDGIVMKQLDVIIPVTTLTTHDSYISANYPVRTFDVMVRFGCKQPTVSTDPIYSHTHQRYDVWMQVFLVDNAEDWQQFTDKQNAAAILYTLDDLGLIVSRFHSTLAILSDHSQDYTAQIQRQYISQAVSLVTNDLGLNPDSSVTIDDNNDLIHYLISHDDSNAEPFDFAKYASAVDTDDFTLFSAYMLQWTTLSAYYKVGAMNHLCLVVGLLCYAATNSGAKLAVESNIILPSYNYRNFLTNVSETFPDTIINKYDVQALLFYSIQSLNLLSLAYRADWNTGDPTNGLPYMVENYSVSMTDQEKDEINQYIDNLFKPYNMYDPLKVSIHCQTNRERISEAKILIWSILAAIVAVTTIAIVHKFRKRRQAKTEIARGFMDNLAWSLPQNPSKDQLKQYMKASRKVKRMDRFNAIIGISSPLSLAESASSVTDRVRDHLFSFMGLSEDNDADSCNIVDIKELITG